MKTQLTWWPVFLLLGATLTGLPAAAQITKIGEGGYALSPKGSDRAVPDAPHRSAALRQLAAPTNQWYSSLIFSDKPEAIYAQPLTVKALPGALEVAYPSKRVVPTERRDVEIHYPHEQPIRVSTTAFTTDRMQLSRFSDWAIDIDLFKGDEHLFATVAHGSPYASLSWTKGDLQLEAPAGAQVSPVANDARILLIELGGKRYAAFGPTGVRWEKAQGQRWVAHVPENKHYAAIAALPDIQANALPSTLALLAKHAYVFLSDTQVTWRYDEQRAQVTSAFKASTIAKEGAETTPLLGLYPHQWFDNPALVGKLGPAYDTVRGQIKLLPASSFEVHRSYGGFVPYWPGVTGHASNEMLKDLMKTDLRNARRMMLEIGNGPYWQGKGLQRITKLMDVVEQQGDLEARDQLLKLLKTRVEAWFSGTSSKTYFHYDQRIGTVVAYPEEYFGVEQMNDHHFHYGYWIRAMADIALRDPVWASKAQWGGMVEMLIGDIANTQRHTAKFPYLRNFDAYESHSWASGIGLGEHGNNQESSSEAINAWAALIQWAEVTGDKALRDLGVYLYTSEIAAIQHYWFDVHGLVFAPEYKNVEVSMVFGGKYAHNTWWTDEPRQIKGINLLPITTASTYLADAPAHTLRSLEALNAEMAIYASRGKRADPPDIWQDVFAKYMALADPNKGMEMWNRWGAFEFGDTRSHTLHWLMSLQQMGVPDKTVTANTTFYTVFKRSDGSKTYLAYNATPKPLAVTFSDGTTLQVPPRQLMKR